MSTDWSKYSDASKSRQKRKTPEDNAVLSMIVGDVRNIQLSVNHNPDPNNRAHSLVYNVDNHRQKVHTQKIRRKLSRISHSALKN